MALHRILFFIAACNNFNIHLCHVAGKRMQLQMLFLSTRLTVSFLSPHKQKESHSHSRRTQATLSQQLAHLQQLALSSKSSSAYKSGCKQSNNFCRSIQVRPVWASKNLVFTTYLSRRVSPYMAHVYLSVVSLLHRWAGLSSPTCHNPRLQLSLWRMARYHSQCTTHTRKAITMDILQRLLHTLQHCCLWCHYNVAMFRAALWVSMEFTTPSYQAFTPEYMLP